MRRERVTRKGEASWDGVNPKTKTYCGCAFGFHNAIGKCSNPECNKWSNYSLHKRYKFTQKLEKYGSVDYRHGVDRLYICSEACFRRVIMTGMFEFAVPIEIGTEIYNTGLDVND